MPAGGSNPGAEKRERKNAARAASTPAPAGAQKGRALLSAKAPGPHTFRWPPHG
jgi:hypothetical protein